MTVHLTYPEVDRHRCAAGRHRAVPGLQPRPQRADPGADRRHAGDGTSTSRRRSRRTSPSSSACTWPPRWRCLLFFWRDWVRIVGGFVTSIRHRRISTADERLAWMIVLATIPVGITGLLLEHTFRTVLGKPIPAAVFLTVNGAILYGAERLRRRAGGASRRRRPRSRARRHDRADGVGKRPADRRARGSAETTLIGAAQILALLPGISRSGATMAAGLTPWPRPRGRGAVLVPAGHAGDLRGRVAQDAGPVRSARRRHPRPGAGRQRGVVRLRLPVGAVPDPLLPDAAR